MTTRDIRALVDRTTDGPPVTSVYLDTDGSRFPRAADYEARLDGLLREVRKAAEGYDEAGRDAVLADADAISAFVRSEFERGDVRGLGVFATGGEVVDTVQEAIAVRNQARVGDTAYIVPLQVLLGRHHHIALALIERDEARIFRYRLGRVEVYTGLSSDVHGRHDQGGWSQARFERNIEHEVHQHMKEAAEILRRAHEDDPFDAIVVAGPHTEAVEFTKNLHSYLTDRVHGEPMSLAPSAGLDEIGQRLQEVEQELVSERRSRLLQRLFEARGTGARGAFGIRHVVEAVNRQNLEILFVVEGAGEPGFRASTGALALHEDEARAFGGEVESVDDLIDEIIEQAVRLGAHIELFRDAVRLDGHPVAALLRF